MTTRRSSGEIVNATLLEIFLALVFIVLGIAWARDVDAKRFQSSLERERKKGQRMSRALDSTGAALAQARFNSRFPPYCENGDTTTLLTITLAHADSLSVAVHHTKFGFVAGTAFRLSLAHFQETFQPVRDSSLAKGCRYRVRVVDSQGVSKDEYKRSLSRIVSIFYQAGAYQ